MKGTEVDGSGSAPLSAETAHAARSIATQCVATRARRLDRTLTRLYNDALRPWRVTSTQLSLLVGIAVLEPVTATALARRMGLEKSSVSRNLRLLNERSWIVARDAADARSQLWSLTSPGAELIREAYHGWREAQRRASTDLGRHQLTMLADLAGPGEA